MKILEQKTENNEMIVTILVEAAEFAAALEQVYQENKEKYIVPDWREGMTPRYELERLYGSTLFYDEALDKLIPTLFGAFILEQKMTVAGSPELIDVSWPGNGEVTFTVKMPILRPIRIGQYIGLKIDFKGGESLGFEEAVLDKAVSLMETELKDSVIEEKLDVITAQEKLKAGQNPIYNVLADITCILKQAYEASGVSRSKAQICAESMDIMLETMSEEKEAVSTELFVKRIGEEVAKYRSLSGHFEEDLKKIIETNKEKKKKMKPEERAEEAFDAYIGSVNMTAEMWRNNQREKAVKSAKTDILLDAVAVKENIGVTEEERNTAYGELAEKCNLSIEAVKKELNAASLDWQLCRDKARRLIVDSAIIS